MKGFCPYCEREMELSIVSTQEKFDIRGEEILIRVEYFQCEDKGHRFDDPKSEDDPLNLAYREYRDRKNFLQPEQIKEIRLMNGLTQKELATLLGLGGVTLSRYENGALQSEGNDKLLRLAMDSGNLLTLAKRNKSRISPNTYGRLVTKLETELAQSQLGLRGIFETYYGQYEPDDLSGEKKLDIEKLQTAIVFFCTGGDTYKTKLNKLLFYADFKHFKEYSSSITGSRYAHLPYGPAPDHYDLFLAMLHEDGRVLLEEHEYNDYVGEIVRALEPPDISSFSTAELKTLTFVKHQFEGHTSRQISELSHKEEGFKRTANGELISYSYADVLLI